MTPLSSLSSHFLFDEGRWYKAVNVQPLENIVSEDVSDTLETRAQHIIVALTSSVDLQKGVMLSCHSNKAHQGA